ncbi:hypothetical protein M8C21_000557, partial [Ambrosia artemisiifolia]
DVLKQPVMLIINQAAGQSGIKTLAVNDRTLFGSSFEKYKQVLDVAYHGIQLGNKKRFIWPSTWRNKVDLALEDMRVTLFKKPDHICVKLLEAEGNIGIICKCIDFQSSSGVPKDEWDQIQHTFEKISTNLIYCGELWKEEKKSLPKRRALSELLKLLHNCGLAKRRSEFIEDQSVKNKLSRWFLQPSYIMEHLLLKEGRLSSGNVDVASQEKVQSLSMDNLETVWKTSNEYFFKSISSLGRLQKVCSNFHKDFTLEQANNSVSYLDHLVEIQTSHRAAAYDLALGLELLKKHSLPLQNLFSSGFGGSFSHNQEIVSKCMWRQKQLFDTMCNILDDECLLLKSVENNHLSSCQSVGAAASQIHLFLEKFAPEFKKSKEMLDNYLFGECGSLISTSVVLYPYGITKQMEQFVQQNFMLIKGFKEQLLAIREQDLNAGLAKKVLLDHFEDIITNGNLLDEYYNSALEERNKSEKNHDASDISRAEVRFTESLRKTCKQIVDGFDLVNSVNNRLDRSEDYLGNINTWQILLTSRVKSLQLHAINDGLVETLNSARNLMDLYGNEETNIDLVEAQLKHLYSLLDLVISFGNGLLNDFMVAHSTLSMVTHALAEIFASLYSQGFGCSTENEEEDNGAQDTTGTGMGEGAGVKDVSEQIEDEDQLLGTEKAGEEQDALNDVPSKNDKGIEMEQDFNADAFSVSEDETDDENNDEGDEPELDSAMGETGDDSKIVDEKLGENEDDENDENPEKNEKYETGPSVKDNDPSGRELRAKEDDVATTDEAGELDPDESNKHNDENDDNVPDDGNDDVEDMNVDKDEAFSEPTGLKPDEPIVDPDDDIDMNQQDDVDHNEDEGTETVDESAEGEEENNQENPGENGPESLTETFEMETEEADQENQQESKTDADMDEQKNDITTPAANNFDTEHQQNYESATQPNSGSNAASMRNVASEVTWSNSDDMQSELAPIHGLPKSSQNEVSVAGSSKAGKLNDEQISQIPEVEPSSLQKSEPNPLRNIGDALEGWKERAKVSVDLEENKNDPMDDMDGGDEDQNADEYGFTSGLEKGTAQALGSAAADQVDKNIDRKEPVNGDGDGGPADQKDDSEMDIEDQHHESQAVKNYPLNIGNTIHDKMEVEKTEILDEASEIFNPIEDVDISHLESSVCVKRSYPTDDISQFGALSVVDDDMGKSHDLEDVSAEMKDSATALWRKYELQTTRLSQELAEQLRLVMEPTLASKLQGDYKTGKRINMKKVIPYIAICRAMSQLEVGNLAVASFGKKGNIKLLHDFDQPFTGEAGVKMVSSLTFKQENTIADEPMVDLLKYLNNTLDSAVINARLPSGQNPLEQLVLIIADGRLHEKENLKRCVRDILSKKRMVAFLLMDNPKESITEVLEASFEGGKCGLVKYMDSFPFPFYVVLKDIESLPRTLADLLRQ